MRQRFCQVLADGVRDRAERIMEMTMSVAPLFQRVVIGAAESSLDVAGSALLPGACERGHGQGNPGAVQIGRSTSHARLRHRLATSSR